MRVVVVGAGKMGLPLACQLASRGATVVACDTDPALVAAINKASCPIDEPGVPELLAAAVGAGRLCATTDTAAAARSADAVVVIVPAYLTDDRRADLSVLETVSRQIAPALRRGALVSYETTVPVGTTRQRLRPLLEGGGLRAGSDFALVFSPERVKSGHVLQHLTRTPKVVGGIDASSAARGAAFYETFLGAPVVDVGSLEAAELVKLAGMVYRDVNIALANELARFAEVSGVDLEPVIAAANTDGEAQLLRPGVGVGGHCTPVYPYFLTWDAEARGVPATLAERARRINDGQAEHAVRRLAEALGGLQGRRVLLLGLGFRPGVKEHRYSSAFLLRDRLAERGATVVLHDPLYTAAEARALGFEPGDLDGPADAAVLVTAHEAYRQLDPSALRARGVRVVLDGRRLWDGERVSRAGILYLAVGAGEAAERPGSAMLPVSRPSLGAAEAEAAAEAIRSGWVAQGPRVEAMEREFAAYVGAPFARAVSSGTAALHLALLAAGVGPGDEVVTVSHSHIATANAVRYCGAEPVFVDVDPLTFNMDPSRVEAALTARTRAILPVHQIGLPCDLAAIVEIGRRRGLPVVEDAACAIGSEVLLDGRWERVGRPRGVVACFSFHPRKVMTTGEGGMATTADPEIASRIGLLRQQGMSIPAAARHASRTVVFEQFPVVGYNYRLTDIQAAIGTEQLRRLPALLARRRALADRYTQALREIPGLEPPVVPDWARPNYQSYAARVTAQFPLGRDALLQALLDRGISARRGVMNAHQEAPYTRAAVALPHSEAARDTVVLLPLYEGMSDADQERVVDALRQLGGGR
jgi:nucleotide sugar dehydrogenase